MEQITILMTGWNSGTQTGSPSGGHAKASSAKNGSAANQSAGFYAATTPAGASNHALTIGLRAAFDVNLQFW